MLSTVDPEVSGAIKSEEERQRFGLELIPSENYASNAVMRAQASVMTNKYAEGYPGKRYYGGCQFYDVVENLARERAKKIFGAAHANVQAHSGAQANMAVYFSCLEINDTVLAMDLAHGGHLTHGSPVSFSGKLFRFIHYGVDRETEKIDMDQVAELAEEHNPKLIVAGASSYSRTIDFAAFKKVCEEVDALFMVDMAHIAGLVAGGAHPSPVPHAHFVTSTTQKTLRGPRGGLIFCTEDWSKKIDSSVFPFLQGGPFMNTIAAKAVCFREALQPDFKDYAGRVVSNAKKLADELISNGFRLVSGGTDNHLMMIDLSKKGMTGKEAEIALDEAGITVNKNAIPFDTQKPYIASGIRLGTPAVTTRGMGESEMKAIAGFITTVLENEDNVEIKKKVKSEVKELCERFPPPGVFVD